MSNAVLIIGESGTGKSTAIRTLPPEETFIINVLDKPLPFRGARAKYKPFNKENPQGNYYSADNSSKIMQLIDSVDKNRADIKYLVIDDLGYMITKDFMNKATQKGFDKFSEMAVSAYNVFDRVKFLRNDLTCFITMHSEVKDGGVSKPKTIGKMLDEKVCIEGMFTFVLHSIVQDGQYSFLTNHSGSHMAKMPMDMFQSSKIPNDLHAIAQTMDEYFNEDILM